jgi:vacuole morphology and inheritance protein 14
MVQNLNMILITAPELSDLRACLKNIESKEGSKLFIALYKSWAHNPISLLSLCLLCQQYEHAFNLMLTFGDLEISVSFLLQIDKLVQLLESPVFTFLRIQLIEPEKYPFLYKCLYGILMLLPQSSAFTTLRNRLNCGISSYNIKAVDNKNPVNLEWNDMLSGFKQLQKKRGSKVFSFDVEISEWDSVESISFASDFRIN